MESHVHSDSFARLGHPISYMYIGAWKVTAQLFNELSWYKAPPSWQPGWVHRMPYSKQAAGQLHLNFASGLIKEPGKLLAQFSWLLPLQSIMSVGVQLWTSFKFTLTSYWYSSQLQAMENEQCCIYILQQNCSLYQLYFRWENWGKNVYPTNA